VNIRNRVRELRTVKAAELTPNPRNWRTHPKAQQDALRGILAEVGYADALLARELPDGSLMLVDGHLRAETTPDQQVPVLVLDISEAEADKLLLSLDPLAALAETNAVALDALLREVDTGSEGLQQMYADLADAAELYQDDPAEIVEDEVPEPPADPITKPGDLWLLGDHRLLCGDSTKAEDVERLMAGTKADLCFTSPPYSDQRTYTGEANLSPEHLSGFITKACRHCEYVAMNLGIARRSGFIDTYWDRYVQKAHESGFGLVSWNVWYRTGGFSVGQITAMFPIEHEFIFVFGQKPRQLHATVPNANGGEGVVSSNRAADGSIGKKKGMVYRSHRELGTVIVSPPVNANDMHPAQFPVLLPAEYIKAFGDSVYEPFCGSGTTLIAAEQLGRKCYGMEISPAYCDVIVKRWETLTGKKAELEVPNGKTRAKARANDHQDGERQPRKAAAKQARAKTRK
jgi:DNA modification methylase